MGVRVVDGWLFLAGPVDCSALEAQGYELGPTEPALNPIGERIHEGDHPVFKARILAGPSPAASSSAPPRSSSPSSSLPTLGDAVRAVFDRHLGPLELGQVGGGAIPAPDPETSLTLLDAELGRRMQVMKGLREEVAKLYTAAEEQREALTKAIWEKDLALQNASALQVKYDALQDATQLNPPSRVKVGGELEQERAADAEHAAGEVT